MRRPASEFHGRTPEADQDRTGDLLSIDVEHPVMIKSIVKNYVIVGRPPPI